MIKKSTKLEMFGSVFLILLVIIARVVFRVFDAELQTAFSINCVCAIVVYAWIFFCIYRMEKGIVNVYSGFVLCSFVFYFGQHLVILLGKTEILLKYYRTILDGRIPNSNRVDTGYFILIVMLIINIGVQCGLHFNSYKAVSRRIKSPETYNECVEFVASIILAVVTVPTFYLLYRNAKIALEDGYDAYMAATAVEGILKVFGFLSFYFLPAIYMLLISCSNSKKKYVAILLYAIYVVLYLCSGSRYRVFESIVALVLIYNYKYKKIKLRDMVKLGLLGVAGITFFVVIRSIREILKSASSFSDIIASVINRLANEGILVGALIETGTTFHIVDVVMYKVPEVVDFCYGKSVLSAVLRILPNFLRFGFDLNSIDTSKTFSPIYVPEMKVGMGSSFIAESYFNFGIFSLFFVFVLGVLIGKMLTSFNDKSEAPNHFQLFKHVYISSMLCFAVRTDLVTLPRYYFYYVILIEILIYITYQRRMKY